MKINEYFDEIYCINLKKDVERYEKMKSIFSILNMEVTRWNGVTDDIFKYYISLNKLSKQMTPAYLACLTSHLTAIRDAYDKGLERILIIEDDIVPRKDFVEKFENLSNDLEGINWDMLYLAYIPLNDDCSMWTYIDLEKNKIEDKDVLYTRNFWSAMAYGLSRKAMENILMWYSKNPPIEIDRYYVEYLQRNENFTTIGSYPQMFAGIDNVSNNTGLSTEIFRRSSWPTLQSVDDFIVNI